VNKNLLVIIAFLCSSLWISAINIKGYIITLQSDTVWGRIQLSKFDQVTGGFVLKGVEEESFHSRVVFCPDNEKRFKAYFPEMLLEFGFLYDSIPYIYKQIKVERKSLFKNERIQICFVRLLGEDADVVNFKELRVLPNPGLKSNNDSYLRFNSYHFRIKRSEIKQTNDSTDSLKIELKK